MSLPSNYRGYREDFLGPEYKVRFPWLSRQLRDAVAPVQGSRKNVLHYQNFSLVQHAHRRFPIYTATNIDGKLFKRLPRHDRWQLDPRIAKHHQWGPSLYKAEKSDFDRGHMTKREDAQWGQTEEEAKAGAISTFYYTNAIPQVPKLNQQLWRGLEDYILKKEVVDSGLKIAMFTGPVLSDTDPVFVTDVEGQEVQLPTLFWKVIYFRKSDGEMYRVGFLMGQEELLEEQELVKSRRVSRNIFPTEEEQLFMEFKKADVYQVNIGTIRTLTKLRFSAAKEPFKDKRSIALIQKEVQGRDLWGGETTYVIDGITI